MHWADNKMKKEIYCEMCKHNIVYVTVARQGLIVVRFKSIQNVARFLCDAGAFLVVLVIGKPCGF